MCSQASEKPRKKHCSRNVLCRGFIVRRLPCPFFYLTLPFCPDRFRQAQRNYSFTISDTIVFTAASASSIFVRSLAPAIAKSGLPPPLPPATLAAARTIFPAWHPFCWASFSCCSREDRFAVVDSGEHRYAVRSILSHAVAHRSQSIRCG